MATEDEWSVALEALEPASLRPESDAPSSDTDAEFAAFLEMATRPDDPFRLEEGEVEQLLNLWRKAQQRGFPELYLQQYDYTIPAGRENWLAALYDVASASVAQQVVHAFGRGG